MSINKDNYNTLQQELPDHICLVAVSKTKPVEDIQALYTLGQRDFGENYVQELTEKESLLPKDINWHFIGHLQSNKVKYIAPFVSLIHSIDSWKLLEEVNRQAAKCNRIINVLLQIHIAEEETKFGLSYEEAKMVLQNPALKTLSNVHISGLMGMSTLTENAGQIHKEFSGLKNFFEEMKLVQTANCKLNYDRIFF